MAAQLTCPKCGKSVDATMKFCRSCGSPLDFTAPAAPPEPAAATPAPAPASEPAAAPAPAPAAMPAAPTACPNCGNPVVNPNQKFCAVCGGSISQAPAMASPAGTAAAGAAGGAAAAAASMQDNFTKAQAGLNNFMGATVDTSNVGADFDAGSVTLSSADDASLSAAFTYFGKSYSPIGQTSAVPAPVVSRRRDDEDDVEANSMAARDLSAREGGTFCGSFANKLQPSVAPQASMVAATSHDEAARRQKKMRLKHKVQLGDMDKNDAVEAADKL